MGNFLGVEADSRMTTQQKIDDTIRVSKNQREFLKGFIHGLLAAGFLSVVLYGRSLECRVVLADLLPHELDQLVEEILKEYYQNEEMITRGLLGAVKKIVKKIARKARKWGTWLNPFTWFSVLFPLAHPFSFALGLTFGLSIAKFRFGLLKPYSNP